jgi:hypothetical protein
MLSHFVIAVVTVFGLAVVALCDTVTESREVDWGYRAFLGGVWLLVIGTVSGAGLYFFHAYG